jgi:RNA polymerase sigma factor (sigma-70 family)
MVSTPEDRAAFIVSHLPLAQKLARRVSIKVPLADPQEILADSKLSLCRAHDAFDPERFPGVTFEAFASKWVRGEILHGLRSRNPISERVNTTVRKSQQAWSAFAIDNGRGPTAGELEDIVPGTKKAVYEAHRRSSYSIDASFIDPPSSSLPPDVLVSNDDVSQKVVAAVNGLQGEHREVVLLVHYEGLTLSEIAKRWGSSPQHVSKIRRQAFAQLRVILAYEQE